MPFTGITAPDAPAEQQPVPLTARPVVEMGATNARSAAGLAALGIITVGDLLSALDNGADLTDAAGVGATTADKLAAEAQEIRDALV